MNAGADYARAELAAAASPWTTTAAAALRMSAVGSAPTFLDDTAARINEVLGAASIDQVQAVRDRALGLARSPLRLDAHLIRLARDHLRLDGARVTTRASGPVLRPDDGALRWRWLSLELPPALLVAAILADQTTLPVDPRVQLGGGHLAFVVTDRPVAETHCHISAAIDPSEVWLQALAFARTAASERAQGAAAGWPGSPPWDQLLAVADFMRVCLAAHAVLRRDASFQGFLGSLVRPGAPLAPGSTSVPATLQAARALVDGRPSLARPATIGRSTISVARRVWGAAPPLGRGDDLLRLVFPRDSEIGVCHAGLRLLGQVGDRDPLFATWFWQYTRIATLFYRRTVQRPGTPGLDWFERYRGTLRSAPDACLVRSAVIATRPGLRLDSYEGRTTIGSSLGSFAAFVAKESAGMATLARRPESGLVLHLVRDRPDDSAASPRYRHPWRFQRWVRYNVRLVGVVERLFDMCPDALLFLRGADVAGRELRRPTFTFAPLVRRLCAAADRAGRRARPAGQEPLRTFGVTIHAGEDFRTLHEGLRRVHELVEYRVVRCNDRIGHGTVLGTEVDRWLSAHVEACQPRGERLDDLAWELDRYRKGDVTPGPGREAWLHDELRRTAREVFGPAPPTVEDLMEARSLRHEEAALMSLGYPHEHGPRPGRPADPALECLKLWLSDHEVRGRCDEAVVVNAGPGAAAALAAIQTWLVRSLALMEVTIEANPSSNLLVADLGGFHRHPALRLQPIRPAPDAPNLLLSVNSDDPAIFATCLADEFAYAYAALLHAGVPAQDALVWIDRVRENGWRSRFTHPDSKDGDRLKALAAQLARTTLRP